ncbi:MAG: lipoprotein signal peptidase [Bacteroidaceae bacterium]|nr:lipoprotein signal peptidase [Bacteroidaceae bacterium]
MSKFISKRAATAWGISILVLVLDQSIKYLVKTRMLLFQKVDITSWFQIYFTENEGMAFGMDFIGTMFLTLFRLLAVVVFILFLRKMVKSPHYPLGLVVCLSMIVSGAAGNIIDNCFYGLCFTESLPEWSFGAETACLVPLGEGYGSFLSGKVVDMFYFPLFTWPESWPLIGGDVFFGAVFNFADASISCGAVAMLLFYSKYITINSPKAENNNTKE